MPRNSFMPFAFLPTTTPLVVVAVGGAPNALGAVPRVTTQRAATPINSLNTKPQCSPFFVFSPLFIIDPSIRV
jgi:hypothetical protein